MDECQHMGLEVLPPDVNESHARFTVNQNGAIRFGMAAIKGVGEGAVQNIIEEREKNGNYTSIYDFFERVNLSVNNRRTLENLALAGGFDSFGFSRSQLMQEIEGKTIIENLSAYGQKIQAEQGQGMTLFGDMQTEMIVKPEIPYCEPWSKMRMLSEEKELVGIYLSAHPLDEYRLEIDNFTNCKWSDLNEDLSKLRGRTLTFVGLVSGVRFGRTKTKNDPYGVLTVEDPSGSHELFLFRDDFTKYRGFMEENCALYIKGTVEPQKWGKDQGQLKFNLMSIQFLSELREKMLNSLTLEVLADSLTDKTVDELLALAEKYKGSKKISVSLRNQEGIRVLMFSTKYQVDPTNEFFKELSSLDDIKYRIN